MKIKRRYIVVSLFVVLTLIIALNYTFIENILRQYLEDQISTFGYSAIFASIFILESIPQPFLSGLVPLTIGIGFNLTFATLLTLAIISSITANYLAYFIGKHGGDRATSLLIREKNYKKSVDWFNRHGIKTISILALSPLPYFPVMGGIFKMKFKDFTLYAIIPRIFHFIIFSSLIRYILQ